jgi:hypothetical protein
MEGKHVALPDFNDAGDLPAGTYPATFEEVVARFGAGTAQRQDVTARLEKIVALAARTGFLDRVVVFGSYVSAKAEPRGVDVILVLRDEFVVEESPPECAVLFNHDKADRELGASVFWVRPGMLFGEPLDSFVAFWQGKRDGKRRGIVEIKP